MFSVFTWLLFIVFLVLKLTGTVDWPWWIVTMPAWSYAVAVLVAWFFTFITLLVLSLADRDKAK